MSLTPAEQFFTYLHKAWQDSENAGRSPNSELLAKQYLTCVDLIDFCTLYRNEIKDAIHLLYENYEKVSTE